MSNPDLIVLQTLGDLLDHGHGMSGWCSDCAETYEPTLLPLISRPAGFDIDLAALIAERGPDSTAIRARRCYAPAAAAGARRSGSPRPARRAESVHKSSHQRLSDLGEFAGRAIGSD
jgi:hypothetical protein